MQLGIGSYALAWAIGVRGSEPAHPLGTIPFMEQCHALGARCVQIGDNLPLDQASHQEMMAIRDKARELGLGIEVGARGLTPNNMERFIELAGFFSSPFIRMVIDRDSFEPSHQEIIDLIKGFLPELKKNNLLLALENHDRLSAKEFVDIIQNTSEDLVGICLDSVNSLGHAEGFAEVSQLLLPHTLNLHIKDYSIRRVTHNMGFVVEGTPAGKGMLPIEPLLNELRRIGKCRSAILELWTPPESDIEDTIRKEAQWARESMQFLKKYF